MNASLTRLHYLSKGIFSILDVGGVKFYTAEHAYPTTKDIWLPKVPRGTYNCTRYDSPNHGNIFIVNDVPDCTFIEIHIGNFPQLDSIGCILIGDSIQLDVPTPMVTNSKASFQAFMAILANYEEFQIQIL